MPVELVGQESFPPVGKLPYLVTLPGHGYIAFRLSTDAKPPGWHEERLVNRRLPILVLSPEWQQVLDHGTGPVDFTRAFMHAPADKLRDTVLLPYLKGRRWFAAKNEARRPARASVARGRATPSSGAFHSSRWSSPQAHAALLPADRDDWETRDHDRAAVRGLRHRARAPEGTHGPFYAAFANRTTPATCARAMGANREWRSARGASSSPLPPRSPSTGRDRRPVRTPASSRATPPSSSATALPQGFRRVRQGVNPELELGRFLTRPRPIRTSPGAGAAEY